MIQNITRSILWEGRKTGITWFHPRACIIPHQNGVTGLMTMQSICGSDVFGPVHWTTTTDQGHTWTEPEKIPGLGRRKLSNGLVEGFCDFVPEYQTHSKSVLVLGWNVYYRDGILAKPNTNRHPVYTVRTEGGEWLPLNELAWDGKIKPSLFTSNCSQRITQSDGKILIPLSIGYKPDQPRVACSVLCEFDGVLLRIIDIGNSLTLNVGRGLLEPTLAHYNRKYYMSIRAEDGKGYVTISDDGLHWDAIIPWCMDDGTALTMSTTQQRWLANQYGLYLVYTRKAKNNINVMRWRAPLYIAQVDPQKLRLIKSTEKRVFPLIGNGISDPDHVARMGNFHTTQVSEKLSWVTTGETLPADGWRGNTLLAGITWD